MRQCVRKLGAALGLVDRLSLVRRVRLFSEADIGLLAELHLEVHELLSTVDSQRQIECVLELGLERFARE
jgi:hypothetical protein